MRLFGSQVTPIRCADRSGRRFTREAAMAKLDRGLAAIVTLMLAGLIIALVGAPLAGLVFLLASVGLLSVLAFVSNANARRTRGWTRAWNPGAAYREDKAERATRASTAADDAAPPPDKPAA
jgi:hypothetical protein